MNVPAATTADPAAAAHAEGGHDDHHHNPHVAHHFDSAEQQFDASKLGMWLFLVTEVLFFSGLFCAYTVYRVNHPEIFKYGHLYLSTFWGALNTCVLLFSSLTMALAVRAAQTNNRPALIGYLVVTMMCAFGFMVIKAIEYNNKIQEGVLWAGAYDITKHPHGPPHGDHGSHGGDHGTAHDGDHAQHGSEGRGNAGSILTPPAHEDPAHSGEASEHGTGAARPHAVADHTSDATNAHGHAQPQHETTGEPTQMGVAPVGTNLTSGQPSPAGAPTTAEEKEAIRRRLNEPRLAAVFFGIYFCLTGLHGIHVLIGIGAIAWILWRSIRGDFSSDYYEPVDLVGLYWHLVDLIWIYLFPLLYLIR